MPQSGKYFCLGPLSSIILNGEVTYLKYPTIKVINLPLTGHLELVKAAKPFLDSQDPEKYSYDRFREFVYWNGKVNIAKYLEQIDEREGKKRKNTEFLVHTAVRYGNFDLVKYMVSKGLTKEEISSGLGSAIINEELKIFNYLSKEVDIGSEEYQEEFENACGHPSLEIIRRIVIAGINLKGDDWALIRVCDSEYYKNYQSIKAERYESLDRVKYLFFYYGPNFDEDIKRIKDEIDNGDNWPKDKEIKKYIHSSNKLEVAKRFIKTLYTKDLIRKL